MQPRKLIEFMNIIEKLKCNTRHSWTSTGRRESVAEHSWRLAVMAMLAADEIADEFEGVDIDKVIRMCLVHDFGEAITGDIPSFLKTDDDRDKENNAVESILSALPQTQAEELRELFDEMAQKKTVEAKLFKALDNLEAIISHNEAPLETWLPLEYTENITYGTDNVAFSEYLTQLKEEIKKDTLDKIKTTCVS